MLEFIDNILLLIAIGLCLMWVVDLIYPPYKKK